MHAQHAMEEILILAKAARKVTYSSQLHANQDVLMDFI